MSEQEIVCAVVRYRVKPGTAEAALELFEQLESASVQEPGCLSFRVHRSLDDAQEFLLYERYRDDAALEAHRSSEHFEALAKNGLFPLLEHREPHRYRQLFDERTGADAHERS